jgi:sulfate adenylyltransferase subunit 2
LWNLFNGKKQLGEHFRVFPISNWTEMDVWQYIMLEGIVLPSLYFSHQRQCIERDGVIYAYSEELSNLRPGEEVFTATIRFRTCGDLPITGAVESTADTLEKVINEVATTRVTERGSRADDKRSETSMEDRKKSGYF